MGLRNNDSSFQNTSDNEIVNKELYDASVQL